MRKTLLTLALAAMSLDAAAANLSDIYQLARKHDAVHASALAAYKAGMEKLPQGQALMRPSINLSANVRRIDSDTSAGDSNYTSRGATLSMSQPLYREQNAQALEQARLSTQIAEHQLRLAEQDLILRTAQAYFDVLQAQDDLAAAEAQKSAIAEQLALARRSFEVGAATIVDTHEAQARYDATVALEIAARNELDVRRRALSTLIMAEAPGLAGLAGGGMLGLPSPNDMEVWVKAARANSPVVAIGQAQAEIARRETLRQRGAYRPTVDLTASYSDSRLSAASPGPGSDSGTALLGLELGWNLYQGGSTDSLMREAVANREKALSDLDNATRSAELNARQAYLGVVSGEARVRALEQALASSEAQLKSTKLGREVGVRTAVDVLNAQQAVYSAMRDLASARYATLMSGLNLKAVAGSLAVEDVQAIDGLLTR